MERTERRRRGIALAEAAVLVVALVVALSACGATPRTGGGTALVLAHHAHEPAPRPSPGALERLRAAAADTDTDDATAFVVADGVPTVEEVDLEPRRPNGDIERGPRIDVLLDERLAALVAAVDRAAAAGTGTDLLAALDRAAATGAVHLVVLSGGLSTTDPLDLRVTGWDTDPSALARDLADRRALPDLAGREVVFAGLGRTAGAQPPIGLPQQAVLRDYWLAVCAAAGADSCTVDDGARDAPPPLSRLVPPVVPVPVVSTTPGPGATEVVEVPAPLLFQPDRCDLRSDADPAAALAPLVERLRSGRWSVRISGRTAPVGRGDGTVLSACRAGRAADLLLGLGVPPSAVVEVRGDGATLDPPTADLAALRRVVFTLEPRERL